MSKRRSRVITLVGSALLAVLASLGVAAPAHATTVTFVPFTTVGGEKVAVLPRTMVAGDCRLEGVNQVDPEWAEVYVRRANSPDPNLYDVIWQGSAYTVSTILGDQWHATFVFEDAVGNTLLTLPIDGPLMAKGPIYTFFREIELDLAPGVVSSMSFVEWEGDC